MEFQEEIEQKTREAREEEARVWNNRLSEMNMA
jgi:hypothetical protein